MERERESKPTFSKIGTSFIFLALVFSLISPQITSATIFQPGQTLEPDCAPGSANCGVAVPQSFATDLSATTTTALAEGLNLYFTNSRFDNRLSATTSLPNITTLSNLLLSATQLINFGTPFYTLFSATTTSALAEGSNLYYTDARVNSYIHASSTIPKTYTTNTFTGANIFNSTFTLGSLNGPLQANAGLVSATTSIGVLYGGTGLTSAPSYGQLFVGNSSGGYTLTATSSLGLGGSLGTVTSVALTAPVGLTVTGSPVTTSGTLALSLTSGYNIPLTASTTEYDSAYSNRITSASSPLSITNHVVSLSTAGDWTGTLDSQEGSYYLDARNLNNFGTPFYTYFNGTTTDALTQGANNKYYSTNLFAGNLSGTTTTALAEGSNLYHTDARVNSYINASSTIPKTYTSNTFTGANIFNGTLTIGLLNGPLQANVGVVSATTSVGVLYGGTGLTTAPTYGKILIGTSVGGYSLSATSTLNINSDNVVEGSSNLFFTNTRFDNRLSATTSISGITTLTNLSLPAIQLTNFGIPFYTYFNGTTTDALTQGSSNKYYSNTSVNSYIHASTTIPKTYTVNIFTSGNTFNGGFTIDSLNGPLQANAGIVSATTSIGVLYGGTGTTNGSITGTGALSFTSDTTNALTLDSGTTGAINLGINANAKTITIGNGTGATSLVLNAGTGNINIGVNDFARTINIGTAASAVQTINIGDGAANVIAIGNTQTGGSVAIGAAMTTGTITIGGTGAQTGTIAVGTGTGTQTINFGTGAGIKTVSLGSTNTSSRTNINAGTGGVFLTGAGVVAAGHLVVCIDNSTKQLFVGSSATTCNTSSALYKHDIADIGLGLDAVNALRPVSFTYNSNGEKSLGFIAEEVALVDERPVMRDDNGVIQGIDPAQITPILTRAIQQVSVLIGDISPKINADGSDNGLYTLVATIQSEIAHDPIAIVAKKITDGKQFLTDFVVARITAIRGYFDEVFANKTHQKTLCVGQTDNETCITKNQLDNLLSGQNVTPTASNNSASISNPEPTSSSTSPVVVEPTPTETSTDTPSTVPEVIAPVVVEPTLIPVEAIVTPEPTPPVAEQLPASPTPEASQ